MVREASDHSSSIVMGWMRAVDWSGCACDVGKANVGLKGAILSA